MNRNGSEADDLVARDIFGGDVDGGIASSRLDSPLTIIGDNRHPGRYLFTDSNNKKIKSMNVSAKTVQTEYTSEGRVVA